MEESVGFSFRDCLDWITDHLLSFVPALVGVLVGLVSLKNGLPASNRVHRLPRH